MNRVLETMTRGALLVGALLLALTSAPAQAQHVQISISPPLSFRLTRLPVYFEGHASYWYNGRWYYQRAGQWEYYRQEPAFLRSRRDRGHAPSRTRYEKPHRKGHGRGHGRGH